MTSGRLEDRLIDPVVYRLALRDLLRSKKALFALIASLVPAVLALLAFIETVGYAEADWHPFVGPGLAYVGLPISIPLMCLILAGGLIADEAEDRTLSYLLVRPIRRRTLYASRGLAVMAVAVTLSAVQVFSTWLVDAVAYLNLASEGQTINAAHSPGVVDATALLWFSLPTALIVAAAAAVLYTAMFGAGSVILPRYHFFGNLAFFAIWEALFGFVPIPTAWVSGNHGLRSWLGAMDPTLYVFTEGEGAVGWFGLLVVVIAVPVWSAIGMRVMERRDFHVTSAAT